MLAVNNLNIQYSTKHLFKNVSASIYEHDRIGLVGANGAGKSTLLKILAGITETDYGVVTRSKSVTLGYLPQEITDFPASRTIYQEAKTAFARLFDIQKELDQINRQLGTCEPSSREFASLLKQQGELQHHLDGSDIFRIKSQIEKILIGLGFKESDFDRPCRTFSGGWLMRLMLAKLLLAKPSYLLLDEPTNHLDLESLTWLEEFLTTYAGGLILISHDRAFLDNVTTSTWEISLGELSIYKGNYSKYIEEKEIRLQVKRAAYENQQAQIQQTMRFVDRFRAKSTKAKQVQSRVKQLAKMERIELEESERHIAFHFPPAAPSGRQAIEVRNLSMNYGDLQVFNDISFELQRGDKLAIVGVNGAGKSTLVRLLAGLATADQGDIKLGHNVLPSYFGQHQAQELPTQLTVLESMASVEGDRTTSQTRSLLGAFLFSGDEVDKKVQVLSGGEKSRLALARMIATPANLLIMDEPTNHLDMLSQDILQDAMAQYDGTIIVVSHNRYFLDQFVNKVLEIKNGKATLHEGNISEYLERLARLNMAEERGSDADNSPQQEDSGNKTSRREERQQQARVRQQKSKKLAPLQKQATEFEKSIETLEEQKSLLEQQLADPQLYQQQDLFTDKSKEYQSIDRRLQRQYEGWEEVQEKIEQIEADFIISE